MKSFEYRGLWWPAGEESRKETGILSYSDEEGIRLSIIGALLSFDDKRQSSASTTETIYGVSLDDECITLQDCTLYQAVVRSSGIQTQEFSCELAYIGGYHLRSGKRDTVVVSSIIFSLNYLSRWLNIMGLSYKSTIDPIESSSTQGASIGFTLPDPIEISLSDATISIQLLYGFEPGQDHSTLRQHSIIQITSENPLPLDTWLLQFVEPIQDLLTFATGHANAITDLNVFVSKSMVNVEPDQPYHEGRPFQVIFQPVVKEAIDAQRFDPQQKLFFYTDVKEQVGEIFRRWLALQNDPHKETLRTVCSLFLNTSYHQDRMFLDTQFLNITQSAELYHRTQYHETLLSKSDFKEFRDSVSQCVPEKYRIWFDEQVRFSNDATLTQRLTHLFDSSSDVMNKLFADRDSFVQKVKNTRNYFTHYSPDIKAKAATDVELLVLTRALYIMMLRLVLMELGFSAEQCVNILTNNRLFQYLQSEIGTIYEDVPPTMIQP